MKEQATQPTPIDNIEQLEYLESESHASGYASITELFEDEPELFDIIAQEWRMGVN